MIDNIEIKNSSANLQLVSFQIGNEEFGINILFVQEINRVAQITKVPNSPEFVEGVINLRGKVIPVIDLRCKLGIPRKEHDKNTRIIVIEFNDQSVGFIVDTVNEVLRIPRNIAEMPPSMVAGVNSDFLESIIKLENRLMILLDIEKIINFDKTDALSENIY